MAVFSVQDAQSQRFLPVENSPAPLCSISMGRKSGGYTYYIREPPSVKACRLCQLPRGGSLWHSGKVCGSSAMLAGVPAPPGGAVAQRLRGYGWRSEKSVKAIAPTGAALAFLCFDFFFRIVKGVQPLARCGVGGVQR